MKGNTFSVVIVKNDKDDPLEPSMYFISTLQDKEEILDLYRIRWHRDKPSQICFKHLKSNAVPLWQLHCGSSTVGINLEDLIRVSYRFVKIIKSV